MFQRAQKAQLRAKVALSAVTGGGKTFTALAFAHELALAEGGKVAVLDSEHGRASLYANHFAFDVVTPDQFPQPFLHSPENYIAVIESAVQQDYAVLVIDSLSHEWIGRGGILEIVDQAKRRVRNDMQAWADATPRHQRLLDTIVHADIHIVATMRAKTDWVMEVNGQGKQVPRRAGMAPQQREGVEFEFDLILDLTTDGDAIVTKTRCPALRGVTDQLPKDGSVGYLGIIRTYRDWLNEGAVEGVQPAPMAPADLEPMAEESMQGEAPGAGVAKGAPVSYLPVMCAARVAGERCPEVVEPDVSYEVDGYKVRGRVLVARSRQKLGRAFCPAHYVAVRNLRFVQEEKEREAQTV